MTDFDKIYAILSITPEGSDLNAALASMNICLSEAMVLGVLRHNPRITTSMDISGGKNNISNNFLLLRLKFFDWAGRQHGFHHTCTTYHAIFKLLSRARLMSVIFDWLRTFSEARKNSNHVGFLETLVIGYAVAGQTDIALRVFGQMRFQGIDLNRFSYHVLFNAFVENSDFDVADSIHTQIRERGHFSPLTSIIYIKSLCKQRKIGKALKVLQAMNSESGVVDRAIGIVVDTLCRMKRFKDANMLVIKFGGNYTYTLWLKNLTAMRRDAAAIDFFQRKKLDDGYLPELVSYNRLIYLLLVKDRLEDVYDILVEMRKVGIMANQSTMSASLCFFCKAGMIEIALQLYHSRQEFGLIPNKRAINHLINGLCSSGNVDEACQVLEESMRQGYFPEKYTFIFLTNVLCNSGKLDIMGKLLDAALKRSNLLSNIACASYVSALCKVNKPEEGYLFMSRSFRNNPIKKYAFVSLINGFISLRRSDMICRLVLEMQDYGHLPTQKLYLDVIRCLCQMGCLHQVCFLLEQQLLRNSPVELADRKKIYHWFIEGFGTAKKPDLARHVFRRMFEDGIEPNMDTMILVLQSYMKSGQISDALNFFNDLHAEHVPSKRMHNVLITGLCKAGRPDQALPVWQKMRSKDLTPSLQVYEGLVLSFCTYEDYPTVVVLLEDFHKTGRKFSSFLYNVILQHTLKTSRFWQALNQVELENQYTKPKERSLLAELVAAFSGGIRTRHNIWKVESVIEKLFPVNMNTYNILMRQLILDGWMDYALVIFNRACGKGYVPNRWTFDIVVHGFCKYGRKMDAEIWMERMHRNGFSPTYHTMFMFNKVKRCK